MEPTKSACNKLPARRSARVPAWLVECLRLGVGYASTVRPDPSTLGVVGERGSRYESCLQLGSGRCLGDSCESRQPMWLTVQPSRYPGLAESYP
jgi:hypothetical protein